MKFQVTMEFDESILPTLKKTPGEFADELKYIAAAKWYELGLVSQEKGARIAGVNRLEFLLGISRIGITPFQYTAREVLEEVDDVK